MNVNRVGLSGVFGGVFGFLNGWSLISFTITSLFFYFFVFNWIKKKEVSVVR